MREREKKTVVLLQDFNFYNSACVVSLDSLKFLLSPSK